MIKPIEDRNTYLRRNGCAFALHKIEQQGTYTSTLEFDYLHSQGKYNVQAQIQILATYTVQLASFPGPPPLVCNYCMTFKLVLARNCKCDFKGHVIIKHRQLESLIGTLNHACKVVRCGRSFLRRMLDLLHGVPAPPMRPCLIRLNRAFRSDLMWWHTFGMGSPSYCPHPTSRNYRWHPTHRDPGAVVHGMVAIGSSYSGTLGPRMNVWRLSPLPSHPRAGRSPHRPEILTVRTD